MECLGGAFSSMGAGWGCLGGGCCCCLLGTGGTLHRFMRLLAEPPVGHPGIAKRRAKPRAPVGPVAPGSVPAWPCKGGDAARTGAPLVSRAKGGPRNLDEPAWSYFTDSVTYSTTVLDAAGNIYLNAQSGLLLSLDPSGEERWRYMIQGHFPPCPALLDGALFTFGSKGYGHSVDMLTGKERWVRKFDGTSGPDCSSVSAADGLIVFQLNANPKKPMEHLEYADVLGVDPASGNELWRYRAEAVLYNAMPAIAGGRIFFSSSDTDLYCLDARTGLQIWSLPGWKWEKPGKKTEFPRSLGSITIYRDECIYITGNPTKSTGIARAHRAGTGEQLWSRDFDQHVGNAAAISDIRGVPTMVVGIGHTCPLGEVLKNECPPYLGTVYGLNAANGEVLWQYEATPLPKEMLETFFNLCPGQHLSLRSPILNLPDSFSMPAIGGDGTVYIGWQAGFILAIDGATGKLLSSFETKEGIQGQPAIGPAGEVVVAAGRHVHCFAD